ncbi:hypothetical protein HMPREF3191_01080 [Veillonellaceae bacterium DNF00626]|nr:hypothetical protein HMPREF3191_01080 [Veillonellaceae bacterium DNF00626]
MNTCKLNEKPTNRDFNAPFSTFLIIRISPKIRRRFSLSIFLYIRNNIYLHWHRKGNQFPSPKDN